MYLLNALFESKESKRGCKRGTFFFYKLLVGYILIRIYILLLRISFDCKCKCEKVSKKKFFEGLFVKNCRYMFSKLASFGTSLPTMKCNLDVHYSKF